MPASPSSARRAIVVLVAAVTLGALAGCDGGDADTSGADPATSEPASAATSTTRPAPTSTIPATTTTTVVGPPPDLVLPGEIEVSMRVLDPAAVDGFMGTVRVGDPTLSDSVGDAYAALADPTDRAALAETSPAWCSIVSAPDGPLVVRVGPLGVDEATGDVSSVEIVSAEPLGNVPIPVEVSAVVDGATVTATGSVVGGDVAGDATFTATTPEGRVVEGAFRCTGPDPSA